MKKIGTKASLIGFALAAALVGSGPARAAPPGLRVEFVGGISGAAYATARDEIDGFRLAIKELGGKLAGVVPVLTANDERYDPAHPEAAFESLSGGGGLRLMLLSATMPVDSGFTAQAEARQQYVINLGPSRSDVAGADCSSYFFSLAPAADTSPMLAGAYFQASGAQRIALVEPAMDDAASDEQLAALRADYRGEIDQIRVRLGEMEFAGAMRALRARGPQAIYLALQGGMAVNFLIRLRQSAAIGGMPVYASAERLDQRTLEAAGPAGATATYTIGPWRNDLDSPANRKLVADFATQYSRSASYAAAQGYDAALMIDAALRAAGGITEDPDALAAGFHHAAFSGTRPGFHFDSDQFPVQNYFLNSLGPTTPAAAGNPAGILLARDLRPSQSAACALSAAASPPPAPPPPGRKRVKSGK